MPFLTINGVTIPIADAAASSSWQRTYSGPGALTSGSMRKSHRNHRRSWTMETHPLPSSLARTIAEWVVGNQHVGLFYEGVELSTGLAPIDTADVRLSDLGLDERGGGLTLLGATGSRALGRISYPAQLCDRWTIIWQETTDGGTTWVGAALRDDGTGYVSGVADATAGAAGTTLQVSVLDGVAILDSGGVDVGIHQLVVAPYRVDVSWLVTMTADGFNQQAPSPIHEVRGDALPDRFRYAIGRGIGYAFVPRPDATSTWDQAARSVSFELVEVDEPMRQSEIVSGAIVASTTAGGAPALDPVVPPEEASLSWWYDSEVRGVGDVPLNQGADTYTAMAATGSPNVVQKTVGATANVDVWQQTGTTDYYQSDPGSGLSNPYLVNVGEDATFVWLVSPISANGDALQPYAGNQRSNSASVLSLWDSYYVGYAGGAAAPSTWTFRFDSGVEGATGACTDLSRFLVVAVVLKNSQINGSSPAEFYDLHVRELASGSSWASRTDSFNRSETLREAHRMFYPGDHFEGCVQSWMFYKQLALSAAQLDELYDYFAARFGEA